MKTVSLVQMRWFLAVVTAACWSLVLVDAVLGPAALDREAPPIALVLTVVVTILVVQLPPRWMERRGGAAALRIPSATALLLELPGFAGLVAVGLVVSELQDLRVAMVLSAVVSVWVVAAPSIARARSRSDAAMS